MVRLTIAIACALLCLAQVSPQGLAEKLNEAARDQSSPRSVAPKVLARLATVEAAKANPEPVIGRMRVIEAGCGPDVRPYIWSGVPRLGGVLAVSYNLFPLPREDGIYDVRAAWIVVSLIPPRGPDEPFAMIGECPLYVPVPHPLVLVWLLQGQEAYHDPLLSRERNDRSAKLRTQVPTDTVLMGMRSWTQIITLGWDDRFRASSLYEVTFGV